MTCQSLLVLTVLLSLWLWVQPGLGQSPPSASQQGLPICQKLLPREKPSIGDFDLQCFCSGDTRRFVGSLSRLLAQPFADLLGRQIEGRNRSVLITNCKELKVSLDFGALAGGAKGSTFRLKIAGVNRVHVNYIGLALDQLHLLQLENVGHRASLVGSIECYQCANKTRSSSMQQPSFAMETERVKHLTLYKVNATLPLRLTSRNSRKVVITQSVFETIPRPGFLINNVTRASLTHNVIKDAAPNSVVAKQGAEIIIADNILDVGKALDVSLFKHMTIRCNKPTLEDDFSSAVICESSNPKFITEIKDYFFPVYMQSRFMFVTVLGTIMIFGSFWLPVFVVGLFFLNWCNCCTSCCCRGNKKKVKKDPASDSNSPPTIMTKEPKQPKASILKQKPKDFDQPKAQEGQEGSPARMDKFVRVDTVSEKQTAEEEGGVVTGSISLGGHWPDNVKKIKSVSKDNDRDNNEVKVSPRHEGEKLEAKKLEADPEVKEVRRGRTTSPEAVSTDYERMRRDRTRSPDIGDDDGRPRAKSPPPQLPRLTRNEFKELKEAQMQRREKELVRREAQREARDQKKKKNKKTKNNKQGEETSDTDGEVNVDERPNKSKSPVKNLKSQSQRTDDDSSRKAQTEDETEASPGSSGTLGRYTTV